jgi:hypothetical protein
MSSELLYKSRLRDAPVLGLDLQPRSERSKIPDAAGTWRTIDGGLEGVLGDDEGDEGVENGRAGMMKVASKIRRC